jgi:hypothetical protein
VAFGRNTSAGHAAANPVHISVASHTSVAARHTVAFGRNTSAGHAAADPVQFSATSQTPAEARQPVEAGKNVFTGQEVATPSQSSCTSHDPAEARQTVPPPHARIVGGLAPLQSVSGRTVLSHFRHVTDWVSLQLLQTPQPPWSQKFGSQVVVAALQE